MQDGVLCMHQSNINDASRGKYIFQSSSKTYFAGKSKKGFDLVIKNVLSAHIPDEINILLTGVSHIDQSAEDRQLNCDCRELPLQPSYLIKLWRIFLQWLY